MKKKLITFSVVALLSFLTTNFAAEEGEAAAASGDLSVQERNCIVYGLLGRKHITDYLMYEDSSSLEGISDIVRPSLVEIVEKETTRWTNVARLRKISDGIVTSLQELRNN